MAFVMIAGEPKPFVLTVASPLDDVLLVRISEDEPSYVNTERLGEAAQLFFNEVIRLSNGQLKPIDESSA